MVTPDAVFGSQPGIFPKEIGHRILASPTSGDIQHQPFKLFFIRVDIDIVQGEEHDRCHYSGALVPIKKRMIPYHSIWSR